MNQLLLISKRFVFALIIGAFVAALLLFLFIRASVPGVNETVIITSLKNTVHVRFDPLGNPTISAVTDLDAYNALGYLTARERLFQMDLIRRKSAGRLSEVFGDAAINIDTQQRHLQLERAAKAIVNKLPVNQTRALQAYVDGVNTAMQQMPILPFEFLVLNYTPESWRLEDSILIALSMFQVLSSEQESERMLSVMEQTLPNQVTAFLTPDVDEYDSVLVGGHQSWRPKQPIPAQALATVLNSKQQRTKITDTSQHPQDQLSVASTSLNTDDLAPGSNAWVVAGAKTSDGRAILANDMHLSLRVPNIWYRATIKYAEQLVSGVTLPGLPLIIAGSNNHVAWGYTNAYVDLVDLVKIDINPDNPEQYRILNGWANIQHIKEQIRIKDSDPITVDVRYTRWGPLSTRTLLGSPVALKWTALDPSAVDLGLINLHTANTLEQAIDAMNNAGGPPQNAMLADQSGRIAWTLMGKIPKRHGFDGLTSRSWVNPEIGWDGYLDPNRLPRVIDPETGFIATANNRIIGKGYPVKLGHDYQMAFRAWRINQRLEKMHAITEQDMLDLQLDTETEFYRYYQKLAFSVLTPTAIKEVPERRVLLGYLQSWDGKAELNSTGLPVLYAFRKALINTILPAYYQQCLKRQPDFRFSWSKKETPVRQLLNAKIPATLPHPQHYASWDALILDVLESTAQQIKQRNKITDLADLTWGNVNTAKISHPFSAQLPLLGGLLDMPENPLSGCPYCVRVVYGLFGASERMVVSPGHLSEAILHMPTGQSGHPLSNHYRDQQPYWEYGKTLSFLSNTVATTLELRPMIH